MDTRYFHRYVDSRGIHERVQTYWRTDQADKTALRNIFEKEFDEPLDLVIEDASHMYNETRASFHVLFPLLKPGGLYIIEDWAWGHWPDFVVSGHPWESQIPLTRLILELMEVVPVYNPTHRIPESSFRTPGPSTLSTVVINFRPTRTNHVLGPEIAWIDTTTAKFSVHE